MGEPALASHASSKTHQTALKMSHGMESSVTISREKTLWLKNRRKSFTRGKTEWGNFTVFREPIKHNKICPQKGTKQSRNIVGIKIGDVTLSYSSSRILQTF